MAKFEVAWSHEARIDLLNILDFYFERNGNAVYCKKLYNQIKKITKLISKNPFIGIKTDIESVRTIVLENYQIIYEVFENEILIIMLWDCRQNPMNKLVDTRVK